MICVSLPLSAHFFFSTSFIWWRKKSVLSREQHVSLSWSTTLSHPGAALHRSHGFQLSSFIGAVSSVLAQEYIYCSYHWTEWGGFSCSPFALWFSQPFLGNCSLLWTISLIIKLPPAIYPSLDFIPFFCLTGSLRYEPVVRGIKKKNIWWITQYGILVLA